jgi:hypothetical protein
MAMTLMEASKRFSGEVKRSAVIEQFARSSALLAALPFMDINGNAYSYNVEGKLPNIGFRGVNEGYSEGVGVVNPEVERLRIAGGDLDVDKFLVDTLGGDVRADEEVRKIKALSGFITDRLINGNSVTNPDEFDGFRNRVVGPQLFAADVDAPLANSPLSLESLDAAIDEVEGPTALIMSKAMQRKLIKAARANVGGDIQMSDKDEFGFRVNMYNDLPMLIADVNHLGQRIINFDEVGPAGGVNSTSIYVVSFGDGMITGLQNGAMKVTDLGELETKPVFRTRLDWYVGLAVMHPRSISRIWGIQNADVTT